MRVDPDELVDASDVAEILGLANNRAVSTYRHRYTDFPEPIVVKGSGKCVLWLRRDILKWASGRASRLHP